MSAASSTAATRELADIVGAEHVRSGTELGPYLHDATEARNLRGRADAAVLPGSPEEVAEVMRLCYARGVTITPRGGGTGYAGGCVPDGGVVISLERLRRVRALDPLQWRMHVEAGLTTRDIHRLARENGLFFPPNPGAAEQSQIGGNIATNAGGPRAFKYGVTGAWVTGLEAVLPPGELASFGGAVRKDVAGYDLTHLLVGSEGTLGIITSAWLRLIPAPTAALPVVGFYPDVATGCEAVQAAMASGAIPSLIEYLDGPALAIAAASYPGEVPADEPFAVLCEADGNPDTTRTDRDRLLEALQTDALAVHTPEEPAAVAALWRWREGVPTAVDAALGGKVSEDIAVPPERLAQAIHHTAEIGARHDLRTCSWGHAGDGNLHSSFLFDRADAEAAARAQAAADDLFTLATRLGGTITGEHGIGQVKRHHAARAWPAASTTAQRAIRTALDPARLLNPDKKLF